MDINDLIQQATQENCVKLALKFMKLERAKTDINGSPYSINYLLSNLTRYRRAIKNSELPEIVKVNLQEIIKGDPAEKKFKDDQFTINRRHKLNNSLEFNPDKFLKQAIKGLVSKSYSSQLAGLIFLTGRRPNELIYNGKFFHGQDDLNQVCSDSQRHLIDLGYDVLNINSPADIKLIMSEYHNGDDLDNGNYLLFAGQSKQRKDSGDNRSQPYPIPVLLCASQIIDCLEKTREQISIPESPTDGLRTLNDLIHNKYSKTVNQAIKKLYRGLLPAENLSASELRSLYAITSFDIFQETGSAGFEMNYYSQILGHQDKSISASFSYANYEINRNI